MWLVKMSDFVFGSMTLPETLSISILLVSQIRVGNVMFKKKQMTKDFKESIVVSFAWIFKRLILKSPQIYEGSLFPKFCSQMYQTQH